MTVSPQPPWKAGQTISIKATVTRNGTPVYNTPVAIALVTTDEKWSSSIYLGWTNTYGVVSTNWTIEWSREFQHADTGETNWLMLPCNTWYLTAVAIFLLAGTRIECQIAYPTEITISAPSTVRAGEPLTVSGRLTYQAATDPSSKQPLAYRNVKIYVDDRYVGYATTDYNGYYSKQIKIDSPGTHTIKAVFPGEGFSSTAQAVKTLLAEWTPSKIAAIALPIIFGGLTLWRLR